MLKKRRADISIIRIISMVMIILCHITRFYTFIPGSQFYGEFFNVGVEVFFCLSGFLYGGKTIDNFVEWIRKRIQKIWIPVFLVVLADLLVLYFAFGIKTDAITSVVYLLNLQGLLFVDWSVFSNIYSEITNLGPLWFTTIIMICYLLTPAFQKLRNCINKKENSKTRYLIIVIVTYFICFLLKLKTGVVLFYFADYFTGYVLANFSLDKKDYKKYSVPIFFIIVIALFAIRALLKNILNGNELYSCLVLTGHSFIGAGFMISGMELNKKYDALFTKISSLKVVQFFDDSSFYIYLAHGIFCFGVTNYYNKMNLAAASLLFVFSTLAVSELLSLTTNALNKGIDKLFLKK